MSKALNSISHLAIQTLLCLILLRVLLLHPKQKQQLAGARRALPPLPRLPRLALVLSL